MTFKIKSPTKSIFHSLKLLALPSERIKEPKGRSLPVVVSLTSIESRLKLLNIVVRSILSRQEVPEKIVLWLNKGLKDKIPTNLKRLEGSFFEIKFSELDCPHLKLVESLNMYPNKIIVTCDDDHIYPSNWLSVLYETHLEFPTDIIAYRMRRILYDENNMPLPYRQWPYVNYVDNLTDDLMPLGYRGVLYPPYSLHEEVLNQNLFLKLSPKADDLWFKAMSFLKGTHCRLPNRMIDRPMLIVGSQAITLKKENVFNDSNRTQWVQLIDHFNIKM